MTRLLIATTNSGKLREIGPLLAGLPLELETLADLPSIGAPEETAQTFAENARAKARYYASASGRLTVAEDSGLEIDALGGAPGVESARFAGVDTPYLDKFKLLFDALGNLPRSERTARFVCALALVRGDEVLFETQGTVEGMIADEPRGKDGFGYDPIFFYPPSNRTFAEMGKRKADVSHRTKAFRELHGFLLFNPGVLRS